MSEDALWKRAASGEVPSGQPGGPGGKRYFKRSAPDAWRRGEWKR